MKYPFKAGDIFVYIFIVLLTAGSFLGLYMMSAGADYKQITVELDGELIGTYDIPADDSVEEIRIDAGDGKYNILRITKDGADIKEANCPDQVCVRWGKVDSPGETIVCLPHRVIVKVSGDSDEEAPLDDIAS